MEFLYTPQQIAGYKGYYYKVKLGNWSEDQELAEVQHWPDHTIFKVVVSTALQLKLKNFIHKKERGTLATTIAEQKFARTLQSVIAAAINGCVMALHVRMQVPLESVTRDGYVHFGDVGMLFNQKTDGCLAHDIEDKLVAPELAFAVSSTWYTEACARTTFYIERYDDPKDFHNRVYPHQDNVLHYGQRFRLRVHPALGLSEAAYLKSCTKNAVNYSRVSKAQEVCMSSKPDFMTVWEVQFLDPQYRLEMEGMPVQTNVPILINHCGTNCFLGSDTFTFNNDYGKEYEVFCKTCNDNTKGQLGCRDKRLAGEQNRWCFVTAPPSESDGIENHQSQQ
jgi:hypothetical protein